MSRRRLGLGVLGVWTLGVEPLWPVFLPGTTHGDGAVSPVRLWFLVTLLRCGYLSNNLRTRMAIARAQS